MDALRMYRSHFKPSAYLDEPYAMACVNVIAADSSEDAAYLATSFQQLVLGLFRNDRRPLPPPVASMDDVWTEQEKLGVQAMAHYSFVGNPAEVKSGLEAFLDSTGVDELMVTSHFYDIEARKKSLAFIAPWFRKAGEPTSS
jgi:alkanesulfonate monooxygenase SsuD/methylene tetrahydromethanopterin reductase-like flavin-dependent oxidoreductase (luciferase family)